MPRTARIFQQSLCYHVTNRGINRHDIFVDDSDRTQFLDLVKDYKKECGASVYHWALMSNHYHMIVEVVFDNLTPFVAGIQQTYAQHFHSRHGTGGTFWQSRYSSKPVEIGPYLAICGRYVERNPVRAGMLEIAEDYRWSSAASYVVGRNDSITDWNPYLGTGTEDKSFKTWYREALAAGLDDDVMKKHRRNQVIGSDRFRTSVKKENGRYRRRRGRPAIHTNSKAVRINE